MYWAPPEQKLTYLHGRSMIGIEGEAPRQSKIPYWRLVWDQKVVTDEVLNHPYNGTGTDDDPYIVVWIPGDSRNPPNFSAILKWSLTILVSLITLTIALISSAYSGGMAQIMKELHSPREVTTLGISLFVLGFAFGPLIWAPLSEVFGRRNIFIVTFMLLTAFNAGCAGSQNIQTLIILRFMAGFFGSSPFGNAGGSIADMFPAGQRGIAISLFAAAPLCGPAIGPIIGGFLGLGAGWRWVEGFLAIFSGVIWLCLCFLLPETYAPVLLRRRAEKLSKLTGQVYRSKLDIDRGKLSMRQTLTTALSRPWRLLFREPIVFLFCVYMAIIYGILYLCFAAFPIVFQEARGWNDGIGGLAFLGIFVGMVLAVVYTVPENMHYARLCKQATGRLPPEIRLPPSIVGAIALPIGLFWFAWTNSPSIHWMVSIAAGAPFGFGLVLVFLSVFNYLIDAYTIYSASVLAANSALRSLFGAAFPLFTSYLYSGLGIHWASSIPAFLALACVPIPIVFYVYGARIRKRCRYAAEAEAFMQRLAQSSNPPEVQRDGLVREKPAAEVEAVGVDVESDSEADSLSTMSSSSGPTRRASRASRGSGRSLGRVATQYEENPYDIDRVNTRSSAISGHRRDLIAPKS
ncbi:MFS transporter [Aspergillus clavatus NRRL 1]|uniref:MFS multidrug transporter, putative n=1 Tax=Aspergillus clavatus (strain ATCC 1007 / CBS 513.65 / DSM 816 / NCTC 3887 / NRRL 1 / QM 1276 / 107) TaxID=344612 RepID=A1C6K0_ASPCL|nr:MFS multidrug transporter, putative [Aspergillus clavatus NRRL 1]EAW14021.1 MFS multidrug transporter, putative [Aspergillus clavatus NRRL 1]